MNDVSIGLLRGIHDRRDLARGATHPDVRYLRGRGAGTSGTSALLAVMGAVKEFARAALGPVGAHSGTVETYVEVPFMLGDKRVYPDGLIRVTRGTKSWTALVEVKTGRNELATEQLENYLDVAREQGFDALITISNEISPVAGQHPTKVDKRKLRRSSSTIGRGRTSSHGRDAERTSGGVRSRAGVDPR